ncbi:hypothetical protein GCM10023107_35730 [Actinoplanes octamycinicus]|nr:hypothetical protein Aoc01nite_28940 [Actinoplanes octamycinicus]
MLWDVPDDVSTEVTETIPAPAAWASADDNGAGWYTKSGARVHPTMPTRPTPARRPPETKQVSAGIPALTCVNRGPPGTRTLNLWIKSLQNRFFSMDLE